VPTIPMVVFLRKLENFLYERSKTKQQKRDIVAYD
jgi:hypothetical protein